MRPRSVADRMERRIDIVSVIAGLLICACCYFMASIAFGASDCRGKILTHERHVTSAEKRAVFDKAGVPYDSAHRRLYVVDHIVPLELGGQNDITNLQLQSIADGHAKDAVEGFLRRCVCAGSTSLPKAQEMVVKWKAMDRRGACPQ